jgi:hypothetical protein
MTVGHKDGVDDTNNSGRKLDGCDEESGDQGSDERSTKRDGMEIHTLSTTGCTSSAPVITTSVSNPSGPCSSQQPRSSTARSHDQHHFLRSSVRPPSKRIRKDSIAPTINGHIGAKSKGMMWKCLCPGSPVLCVIGVPHPSTPRLYLAKVARSIYWWWSVFWLQGQHKRNILSIQKGHVNCLEAGAWKPLNCIQVVRPSHIIAYERETDVGCQHFK